MNLCEIAKRIPFDSEPQIGWWQDRDPLILYHGSNIKNLDSILDNGLTRKDPRTGMISLAFDPNTARAYASMYGGEAEFRHAGARAAYVPMKDRVVIVCRVPKSWLQEHMDKTLGGNLVDEKKRLQDKDLYQEFNGPDFKYYELAELRVDTAVPANFIEGYMA